MAAPWFIGAAIGLRIIDTFSVGQHSFVVGEMSVAPGSALDGLHMHELSTHVRVIATSAANQDVELHPRRDAVLQAGHTVYLIGPYREVLETLRKGQAPNAAEALS